jgi:hypothetical protein
MRRAEPPRGFMAGLADLSKLPERVPVCLPVGTFDAQELAAILRGGQ